MISREVPLPGDMSPIAGWDIILELFRFEGGSMNSDETEQTLFPCAFLRAWTLRLLLLLEGASSVSVEMVEHTCSLCSLNPKHRHEHSACRFWAPSLQMNEVLIPLSSALISSSLVIAGPCWSLFAASVLCGSAHSLFPLVLLILGPEVTGLHQGIMAPLDK